MLERFLRDEKHPENICIEKSVKLLLGDFFQGYKFVNAGVIDQGVDFAERFLRFSEEPLDFRLLRDVASDRDGFSAPLTNFVHHAIGVLFRRSVVNNNRSAFRRELFRDSGADSFRGTCYHRNFSI